MKNNVTQSQSTRSSAAASKQAAPAVLPAATKLSAALSHEAIAQRAYDIYEHGGRQQGQCSRNWRQAEKELSV